MSASFRIPVNKTPIPSRHLESIFEVIYFSTNQKRDFMQVYRAAHPRRVTERHPDPGKRQLTIEVLDLGEETKNRKRIV